MFGCAIVQGSYELAQNFPATPVLMMLDCCLGLAASVHCRHVLNYR